MMPPVVAHADWGSDPKKRWVASATLGVRSVYRVEAPTPVGDPATLLGRLHDLANGAGAALVGFDFPIGIPERYAQLAGVDSFSVLLPELGGGEWADFYRVCEHASEISLHRPFYPRGAGRKGEHARKHLWEALEQENMDGLLRLCERRTAERRAACSLFWTLGGNQVGKAAISGWSEVLAPTIRDGAVRTTLWPFDGTLTELVAEPQVVIAETYPTEFYGHLGIALRGSKRDQQARAAVMPTVGRWLQRGGDRVILEPSAEHALESAFGAGADGEDQFDAFVGLLGMLNIVLGLRSACDPRLGSPQQAVEGWILGQEDPDAHFSTLPL